MDREQFSDKKKESEQLNFKAINSGLGFHPFSDGLPYAPVSKSPSKPGTSNQLGHSSSSVLGANLLGGAGAVAAGPPQFAGTGTKASLGIKPGSKSAPRISVPVAPSVEAMNRLNRAAQLASSSPLGSLKQPYKQLSSSPSLKKEILAQVATDPVEEGGGRSSFWDELFN